MVHPACEPGETGGGAGIEGGREEERKKRRRRIREVRWYDIRQSTAGLLRSGMTRDPQVNRGNLRCLSLCSDLTTRLFFSVLPDHCHSLLSQMSVTRLHSLGKLTRSFNKMISLLAVHVVVH